MKPLIVLIGSFLFSALLLKLIHRHIDYKLAARIAMTLMLVFTAIGHFAFGKGMQQMLPDFIPYRFEIVILTGIMEICLAIGLLFPQYRIIVGWMLIAFFVLVLPANIYAALNHINYQTGEYNGNGLTYLWFRVPLQLFFIVWVYFSSLR
ncbi:MULTISPECIES: DoxX family protein [Galbibacter]|uniref:DoxX family membrane protein n=1 Tax=Galbibacter pacificus TaxID=2996052 RepID=A0ABT6FR77_9FLAO|nr:hypothetical protein [Galbibacter pacificus]MDG3581962.1 hypothetical protein [Galbibacter pacificus]MDG3585564.1 hypothetical protein [Galbibacter pacificus]